MPRAPRPNLSLTLLALAAPAPACGGIAETTVDEASSGGAPKTEPDGALGASPAGGAEADPAGAGGARSQTPLVDCPALSQSECAAARSCQRMIALSVDLPRRCWEGPPVYHGCHARGCPASMTVAQDLDDALWLFSDGCLPEGWKQVKTIVTDECERD